MIDYILCLIGIFIYFLTRYANKREKNSKLSISFWVKDNWPELISTLALNMALMIIIHLPGVEVDINPVFSQLPFSVKVAGIPTLSFFLGLGLTWAFYNMFKSKTK